MPFINIVILRNFLWPGPDNRLVLLTGTEVFQILHIASHAEDYPDVVQSFLTPMASRIRFSLQGPWSIPPVLFSTEDITHLRLVSTRVVKTRAAPKASCSRVVGVRVMTL